VVNLLVIITLYSKSSKKGDCWFNFKQILSYKYIKGASKHAKKVFGYYLGKKPLKEGRNKCT